MAVSKFLVIFLYFSLSSFNSFTLRSYSAYICLSSSVQ
ncbi:unnamed protein product [Schistosoma mattheei]|uniref:Uncharacterized protein n=1 Tax=Schistosoma mattheei TaxID=31246 RepID=A0A3P7YTZ4_9TREM|nr:unnamed protein product [Schistosoma mattheei]